MLDLRSWLRMAKILVIEDDEMLRGLLCDLFAVRGCVECVALASLADLEAYDDRVLGFDLAILDVNLGVDMPTGVDVYRWLRSRHFAGHIAFLTGHARSFPLVADASRLPDVRVLEKPVSTSELTALLAATDGGAPRR